MKPAYSLSRLLPQTDVPVIRVTVDGDTEGLASMYRTRWEYVGSDLRRSPKSDRLLAYHKLLCTHNGKTLNIDVNTYLVPAMGR